MGEATPTNCKNNVRIDPLRFREMLKSFNFDWQLKAAASQRLWGWHCVGVARAWRSGPATGAHRLLATQYMTNRTAVFIYVNVSSVEKQTTKQLSLDPSCVSCSFAPPLVNFRSWRNQHSAGFQWSVQIKREGW